MGLKSIKLANSTKINLIYPKPINKKTIKSLSTVIKSGLSILFENPIIREGAQKKALSIIKSHFTFSSDEIFQAYEDSYSYSITAISAGLAAPDKKIFAFVQKVIYAKVTCETKSA